jgi:hypothetical protein
MLLKGDWIIGCFMVCNVGFDLRSNAYMLQKIMLSTLLVEAAANFRPYPII